MRRGSGRGHENTERVMEAVLENKKKQENMGRQERRAAVASALAGRSIQVEAQVTTKSLG